MTRIRTAQNQNLEPVEVGALDTENGVRLPFDTAASAQTPGLPEGVYLISATAPCFLRIGQGSAGDAAGSLAFGAGALFYVSIPEGAKIAAIGTDQAGAILAVPLVNA